MRNTLECKGTGSRMSLRDFGMTRKIRAILVWQLLRKPCCVPGMTLTCLGSGICAGRMSGTTADSVLM
jgi:hypothetical protein